MFGILFLYFIGKYFYTLAEKNEQNKWLYAILAIVVFYAGTFIGGIILGIFLLLFGVDFDWENNQVANIIALPFGFLADYLFYIILKKRWKVSIEVEDEIQDIGKKNRINILYYYSFSRKIGTRPNKILENC